MSFKSLRQRVQSWGAPVAAPELTIAPMAPLLVPPKNRDVFVDTSK